MFSRNPAEHLSALAILVFLLAVVSLLAPRLAGNLFSSVGLSRVALWFLRIALARAKGTRHAAAPAIDFARAVERSVRRRLDRVSRERLLAEAEAHLHGAVATSALARAWLGRIELLEGRRDEAERELRLSLEIADSVLARFELARIAISRRAFDEAAEFIAPVPWWKSLEPERMFLRSIVFAHAGRLDDAKLWLFWARRSRSVRRRSHIVRALISASEGDLGGFAAALSESFKAGVAVAVGAADSTRAIREVFATAARRKERHPRLDRMVQGGVDASAEEAAGDYAFATGDPVNAVRLWCRAGARGDLARATARARAEVVAEECLAAGRTETANRIVAAARLEGAFREEVGRRASFAFLAAAAAGERCASPEKIEPTLPARVRALIRLLRGEVAAARAELEGVLRKNTDPIAELLAGRRSDASADVATWRAAAEKRRLRVADGVRAFREAVRDKKWDAAANVLAGVSWRFSKLAREIEATENLVGILAGGDRNPKNLESIAESFSGERMRALAGHDVAVEIERERLSGGHSWSGWRRFAAAWDEALSQKAFAAFVNSRALLLDDPRIGRDAARAAIEGAEARLVAVIEPWIGAETKRRSLKDEVARSRLMRRASEAIAGELCAAIEHANARAEAESRDAAKENPKSTGARWRPDVETIAAGHAQLENLGVMAERASALAERSSRTLINLGVDLNAAGLYADAIDVSLKAKALARAPVDIALCDKNIAVYRANMRR